MAHGFVTTGVSFPDATIQTTAGDLTPTGTYIVAAPYTVTPPGGWLQVTANLTVPKATYPALNAVIGNETWAGQLGDINAAPIMTLRIGLAGGSSVSTGDRTHTRIATNGTGTWLLNGDNGRIWRSLDNAATWNQTPVIAGAASDVYCITFGNGAFVVGGSSRLARSLDGGATWLNIANPGGISGQNFHSVIYEPVTGRFVASTSAGFFATSTDNGATWTNQNHNFPDRIYSMAAGQGYIVYGSTSNGEFGYSTNGGTTWVQNHVQNPHTQRINKIVYQNDRFFAISDNGDISYTKRNSNPTLAASWIFRDNPLPSRNNQQLDQELTDVAFIPSAKIWIIGTNTGGSKWFWAPDEGTDEIPYWYEMTGMHPNGQQGFNDSATFGNILVQNSYGLTPGTNDGYGNLTVGDGVVVYNFNNLTTPPSTHFYVPPYMGVVPYSSVTTGNTPASYPNIVPKVFVKT